MAKAVKLTDVVKTFTGCGEEDIVTWIERLEVVAELQEIDDLAPVIPLFLEGPAYDVFTQMPKGERSDEGKVKEKLIAAFGMSPSEAYSTFKVRVLQSGEAPDGFLADLRRLARTVCSGGDAGTIEQLVVCQFVDGLPEPTRSQLRALMSGGDWKLQAALECAKSMLRQRGREPDYVGGLVGRAATGKLCSDAARTAQGSADSRQVRPTGQPAVHERSSQAEGVGQSRDKRCRGCNRLGHLQRDCRTRCYICDRVGHLKRDCPNRMQGNEQGGAA